MQTVATDKTGFDKPYDPISSSGPLRFAVDFEAKLDAILNGDQPFDRMLYSDPTELAITGGVLAATSLAVHTVAAQSGTSDDLDTIPAVNNTYLYLKAKTGHSIALTNAGNINSGINVSISGNRMVKLYCQGGQWGIIGMNRPKINITATTDPGSGSDALAGYSVGSLWINTTLDRAWQCVAADSGAASWKLISPWVNGYALRLNDVGITPIGGSTGGSLGGTKASANDANNTWVSLAPGAATIGATAGYTEPLPIKYIRPAFSPVIEFYMKTGSDISSTRLWFTIQDGGSSLNADTLVSPSIGFRYSTAAGDTGWVPVLADGVSQTVGSSFGALAINTVYKLKVRIDAAIPAAYFSVNDGAEQALTGNFPAIATDMLVMFALYQLANSFRTFLVSWIGLYW